MKHIHITHTRTLIIVSSLFYMLYASMYINMLWFYNGTLQVIAGELFQRQDHFSHSKCKALFQVVHGYWHLERSSNIFESSRTSTVTMLSRKR